MSEADALREGAATLTQAGVPDPQREARLLWRAAPDEAAFLAKIAERATRKPLSHVLGYRDFYKQRFLVTGDVLDPRPDTETLVEVALQEPAERILDLGTGSGCILLSILDQLDMAKGAGTDISEAALDVATRNADLIGLASQTLFLKSHWFEAVSGQYDLIVSNPPYIAADEMDGLQPEVRDHEPRIALTDEADGLTAYRMITAGAPAHLTSGGRLIVEIGPTQAQAVSLMMQNAGLQQIRVIPDLDGRDRVVEGRKP